MSVSNFIPTIWSAKIFQELEKAHILVPLCNRDYEGEITSYGDTVKINSVGSISIDNYVPNSTEIDPEQLDSAQAVLEIDQAKYFAFYLDDVDNAQTKPKLMGEAMRKAAYALADTADGHIASLHSDAGISITAGNTQSDDVIPLLSELGRRMSENNVPQAGRWLVVPPWFQAKLVLAQVVEETQNITSDDALRNGWVGRCFGFDVYMSNNLNEVATTPQHNLLAGTNRAISFAEQVVKLEAYRPEDAFSDAVKGLHVYGAKVIDPASLASIDATWQAES